MQEVACPAGEVALSFAWSGSGVSPTYRAVTGVDGRPTGYSFVPDGDDPYEVSVTCAPVT